MKTYKEKVLDALDKIEKKPIFIVTGETVVEQDGEKFTLPRCGYVQIDFHEWNEFRDVLVSRDA